MFERDALHDLHLVLIDADRRVRRSLAGILAIDGRVDAVATAADVEEAIALVRAEPDLDAVLVDLEIGADQCRLECISRLRVACPDIPVVALTDDVALGRRALLAGADLSVDPSAVVDDICQVLERIPNRLSRGGRL